MSKLLKYISYLFHYSQILGALKVLNKILSKLEEPDFIIAEANDGPFSRFGFFYFDGSFIHFNYDPDWTDEELLQDSYNLLKLYE